MAKATNDYTKMMKDMMGSFPSEMKDMMGSFPVDMSSMQDAFKSQADFADKMSKVVLEAAEKSAEISAGWTKSTLGKVGSVTTAKEDPAGYTKAMTDFASEQAEMGTESMAAFAEIAKKVQMETVDLMLAAGKDMGEEATAAVKKATNEATAAAKKATAK